LLYVQLGYLAAAKLRVSDLERAFLDRQPHHKTATTALDGLIYAKKLQTAKLKKPKRLNASAQAKKKVSALSNSGRRRPDHTRLFRQPQP